MTRLRKTKSMATIVCEVCRESFSKYKCSTCFSPYCSVDCYKIHKNEGNCKIKEKAPEKDVSNSANKQKYFTDDTLSEEKLRRLGESEILKNMLSSKYFQSTLIALDNASNPEETLKQAMKDPEFVEFVDECLKIVEESPW